ncbi:glutathione S-transferase 1 [Dermacentor silvarum]|uniref:glutathione S-transferase 1 n=1 Tax=Dermacentor silvarum TaxID=543639 RepID=UPI00189B96C0|nr:glutathione S-transferase 1 [Dermacentor silvarum]
MPSQAPILYNLPGSPPCGFVRSLAKHLGVEITLKNLDFAKKEHLSEEYLKINPFHKVPSLVDDDFIVYESNAIAYYLLRKHAPESDLYPDCYKERARIDIVLAAVASTIQPFQLLFFRPRFWDNTKPSDEEVASFETTVVQGLQHLVSDGKYATGDKLTLADLCLVSNLSICLENGSVDTSKFPKLTAYYERMKTELPYFEEIYRPAITYLQQRWSELK